MEQYYVGTDLKFKIELTAEGFNQGTDKYYVDVYCEGAWQHIENTDIVAGADGYYMTVNTEGFMPGTVSMVVTAFVPDEDCPGGVRKEVGVQTLCQIIKTL